MTAFAKRNSVRNPITRPSDNSSGNRNSLSRSTHPTFHPRRRIRKGFFINPHLRITGINAYPHKIHLHIGDKVEQHDCIVWTLNIQNKYGKISKNVNNCGAKVYFYVIQKEMPLKWRSASEIYWNKDFYSSSLDKFYSELGATCVFNIYNLGLETIDIPPSKDNEVYFLVTCKDISLPFLALRGNYSETLEIDGQKIFMPRQDAVDLVLRYGEEFEFQIRFEGDGYYEEKGTISKVKINSWNDIKLK